MPVDTCVVYLYDEVKGYTSVALAVTVPTSDRAGETITHWIRLHPDCEIFDKTR